MIGRSVGAVSVGLQAHPVNVEVDVANGLPKVIIVGLADAAVSESRDRVRSALVNSGWQWPDRRVTISLSPAFEHKRGSALDLAIAIALIRAVKDLPAQWPTVAVGELGLDGTVRGVPGIVAMSRCLLTEGIESVLVANAEVAAWARCGLRPVPLARLGDLSREPPHSTGKGPQVRAGNITTPVDLPPRSEQPDTDLADVVGQPQACAALQVAATGGHHVLLAGSPGVGKSMLARRLSGILPDLTIEQNIERSTVAEALGEPAWDPTPPFVEPHQSTTAVALTGSASGARIRPGLVSRAHGGVLLLDEAPEFDRSCLEALRQPLEVGATTIARSQLSVTAPARFVLVLTANPCPCGDDRDCRCTRASKIRYRNRISRAVLDRIDIQLEMGPAVGGNPGPSSLATRQRVRSARGLAAERTSHGLPNAWCSGAEVRSWRLPTTTEAFFSRETSEIRSKRVQNRLLALTWSVADLAGEPPSPDHVALAMTYRGLL